MKSLNFLGRTRYFLTQDVRYDMDYEVEWVLKEEAFDALDVLVDCRYMVRWHLLEKWDELSEKE